VDQHLRSGSTSLAFVAARATFAVLLILDCTATRADTTDLAREEQNPVTRFYIMRFEDNAQFGFGPDNGVLNFFRIQPLVPFKLNDNWSLLTRAIIPIVHQPWPDTTNGLSDIPLTLFLTPARTGRFTWGLGPTLILPTATHELIGTEKWSAGPALAGIYSGGPWVIGVVASNVWSFAGDEDRRDVNVMTVRPLVNYNLPGGWYITTSPGIAANWEADAENRWMVPVGGGAGRVFTVGRQRVSLSVESYFHIVSPAIGPDWQLRLQFSLLYPE